MEDRQLPLPGMDDVEEAKQEAIDRVEKNNPDWTERFVLIIRTVASLYMTFTSDDIWLRIGATGYPDPIPWEPRVMGAAFRKAHRLGICEPLSQWSPSQRVACHSRPVRRWRAMFNG